MGIKVKDLLNTFEDENAQIYITKITKPNEYKWFRCKEIVKDNYMNQNVLSWYSDHYSNLYIDLDLSTQKEVPIFSEEKKQELKNYLNNNEMMLLVEIGEDEFSVEYGKLDYLEVEELIKKIESMIKNEKV